MSQCQAVSCSREAGIGGKNQGQYCWYHFRCLVKLEKNYYIPNIQELDSFETWFNGNCGYVISKDSGEDSEYPFYIWVAVYEPEMGKMDEVLSAIKQNEHYSSLERASEKAKKLKAKLQNNGFHDTPMLEVHSRANNWNSFDSLITSPYVIKSDLPVRMETERIQNCDCYPNCPCYNCTCYELKIEITYPDNPDNYVKPLDIMHIERSFGGVVNFEHVGVYIGNKQVCHIAGNPFNKSGARVQDWSDFLKGGVGKLTRFHAVIPFKSYQKITRQIAQTENNYGEGCYNLANRNCEHFANMIVFGIDYSEQINKHWVGDFLKNVNDGEIVNNGKGSTVKLVDAMSESNDKLGYSSSDHRRASQIQARIVVPPKEQGCKLQ